MRKTGQENFTANYIRMLRKEAGRNQDEIAELLGIRRATYSHYETGRLRPSSDKLAVLADYYQTTVDAICRPPEGAEALTDDAAVRTRKNRPAKTGVQGISRDDLALIAAYHHLTEREQRAVQRMMAEMAGE